MDVTTDYAQVDCPHDGFIFAVPRSRVDRCRSEGLSMYCPACGRSMTWGESEADRLRKQLEASKRKLANADSRITHLTDQRDAADRSAAAYKGAATKLRKRVAGGVCPCCSHQFADLARHLATKHPGFARDDKPYEPPPAPGGSGAEAELVEASK